jgi:small subunit ribosomal protein S20
LANIKSAEKRWRQSEKRRARNRSVRSATRTAVRSALASIQSDPEAAEAAVRTAIVTLDKAAEKGIIHRNAAARSKSRLMHHFNEARSA